MKLEPCGYGSLIFSFIEPKDLTLIFLFIESGICGNLTFLFIGLQVCGSFCIHKA